MGREGGEAVTIKQALRRGFWMVTLPALVILLAPWLVLSVLWSSPDWLPSVLRIEISASDKTLLFYGSTLSVPACWLWWSLSVPRWRLWAYSRVEDIDELIFEAIAANLIWPDWHILTKTEICSQAMRDTIRRLGDFDYPNPVAGRFERSARIYPRLPADRDAFACAGFFVDGTPEDPTWIDYDVLAPKWVGIFHDLLKAKGRAFDHRFDGPLSHIRLRFRADQGGAICALSFRDRTAVSFLLLHGRDQGGERPVFERFMTVLSDGPWPAGTGAAAVMSELMAWDERPLAIIVPYPCEPMSRQERNLIKALTVLLAGAYLCVAP